MYFYCILHFFSIKVSFKHAVLEISPLLCHKGAATFSRSLQVCLSVSVTTSELLFSIQVLVAVGSQNSRCKGLKSEVFFFLVL